LSYLKQLKRKNRVPSPSPISAKKEKCALSFTFNFKAKEYEKVYEQRERISNQTRIKFNNELRIFKEILETHSLVYKRSTKFFWNENALKLPILHKLAQIISIRHQLQSSDFFLYVDLSVIKEELE